MTAIYQYRDEPTQYLPRVCNVGKMYHVQNEIPMSVKNKTKTTVALNANTLTGTTRLTSINTLQS